MPDVIQTMHEAYLCKDKGGVEMPPKPGIHPGPSSHLHAMPASIPEMDAAGIKWIGTFPDNVAKGLPTISGLIVLNDFETGYPVCIMDCRRVTAMRTGAKTALAARYLARSSSESVGIIGCGVQGQSNLEALVCEFKIKRVRVYDVRSEAALRFSEEWLAKGLQVEASESPEGAVRDMDIVVTTRPISRDPKPIVPKSWLKPGGFYAPIDYDATFTGDAMQSMDIFVTDDAGQFEHHRSLGYFREAPPPERIRDLANVVAHGISRTGREDQKAMVMNLGLGMDDMALAVRVYRLALHRGIGVRLDYRP